MQKHIAKSFDDDLVKLNSAVIKMGDATLKMVTKALHSAKAQDFKAARAVIEGDDKVDEMEREVSIFAVKMIALRQPMAVDLRNIVTAIRIAGDLERIADCAVNVARRIISGKDLTKLNPSSIGRILRLGEQIKRGIRNALKLLGKPSEKSIINLWQSDKEIDEIYVSIFREGVSYMVEDPRSISGVMLHIFLAKDLERIGDHITNIAEAIYFKQSGELLATHRPKGEYGDAESLKPKKKSAKDMATVRTTARGSTRLS